MAIWCYRDIEFNVYVNGHRRKFEPYSWSVINTWLSGKDGHGLVRSEHVRHLLLETCLLDSIDLNTQESPLLLSQGATLTLCAVFCVPAHDFQELHGRALKEPLEYWIPRYASQINHLLNMGYRIKLRPLYRESGDHFAALTPPKLRWTLVDCVSSKPLHEEAESDFHLRRSPTAELGFCIESRKSVAYTGVDSTLRSAFGWHSVSPFLACPDHEHNDNGSI
ncbi:hypothetical protein M011DRAFT_181637 [Sporormia fimetaria CBS 119925]|uniref:Uncharacterized protein n=1 Tax=Sporormia fimetaria CBS 119925 TaxID=1340428 RepID=A0A6A6VNJ8_9PLEO|nr:hypothetical protein M011DRAFT_181637 [Sporormia fimetaria CBS 119925]